MINVFIFVLTDSIYKEEMLTQNNFLDEIRTAIRLPKNKHYKDGWIP